MLETLLHCPVCQKTNFQPFLDCKDYTVSQEIFKLVKCTICDFVFTNPRPIERESGKYYQAENYISHSNTRKGLINFLYHQVRNRALQSKLQWVSRLVGNKEKKLLDYGCGTGYFLQTCQKAGWQIQGIEPDEGARNLAEKLTQTTMQADAFASFFDTQKYSVITLWHVLEHIHRLDDTIIRLKSLLHESGKLVIAVPNHDSREAKYYDAYWAAYDVPRHLYHFTPKTLPVLMQRLGFRLVERLPMYYDAYYISLLSERYKYGKTNFWKAFWYGRNSNQSAQKTGDYSSVIYVFEV